MTPPEEERVIELLDALVRKAAPDVSTVPKYGGTLYTLKPDEKEGQFCGIFAYKAHVQLAFTNGTALSDPDNALEGTGKFRRHLNFAAVDEVDEAVTSALLDAAVAHSKAN